MTFKRLLLNLRDFPKSLFINLRLFPVNIALKFPIWAKYDTKIIGKLKRDMVILESPIYSKMVTLGIYGSPGISNGRKTVLKISRNGKIIFKGKAQICEGCLLRVDNGKVLFGDEFSINSNSIIWANKSIVFGKGVVIGYDTYIRDSDGHFLIVDGVRKENTASIIVQDHVWIGAFAKIGKGSSIGNNAVVAMNSVVTGIVPQNSIVGGIPAKVIREGTNWSID